MICQSPMNNWVLISGNLLVIVPDSVMVAKCFTKDMLNLL
jgi:hypothetical protein